MPGPPKKEDRSTLEFSSKMATLGSEMLQKYVNFLLKNGDQIQAAYKFRT